MVAKYIACFILVLCVFAEARQRRDAPESSATEDAFKDAINKAEAAIKEGGSHLSHMLGLDSSAPAGDQIVDLIKTQSKKFADQAEEIRMQLDKELKDLSNSTVGEAFSELSKKIEETVESLRKQVVSSDVGAKAAALQDKFQEGISSLVEEGKKLATSLEPQISQAANRLRTLTVAVLSRAVDSLNYLKDKLTDEASTPIPLSRV